MAFTPMPRDTYDAVCKIAPNYRGTIHGDATNGDLDIEFRNLYDAMVFAHTLRSMATDEDVLLAGITVWQGLRAEIRSGDSVSSLWQPVVLTIWRAEVS